MPRILPKSFSILKLELKEGAAKVKNGQSWSVLEFRSEWCGSRIFIMEKVFSCFIRNDVSGADEESAATVTIVESAFVAGAPWVGAE